MTVNCLMPVVSCAVTAVTTGIKQFTVMETELIIAQARAVLEDMPVAAFKIGMVGSNAVATAIASIVEDYPDIPLVLDPVQISGRGDALADETLDETIRSLLIPQTTLITPNSLEARRLAEGADNLDACAQELMSLGCEYVLITGTHENTPQVINTLYEQQGVVRTDSWQRLAGTYHGSGCTLASAIAATIANGIAIPEAVRDAQEYTWQTLKHAYRTGMGQLVPDRLFWAREEEPGDEQGS